MPPKSKPKNKGSPCAFCTKNVSEDAVTCSVCEETAHRYCAGVSMTEFNAIDEHSPYECATCLKKQYVSTMKEMNDTIMALRSEIVELRSALTDLSKKHGAMASSAGCNQWSKVVGKHVRNQQANPSKSVTVQLLSAKSRIGPSNPPSICHRTIGP